MNKIKGFFKSSIENIVHTKLGKFIASIILAFISFWLANVWSFMFWVGCIFMIYPVGLFCVMMVYAWIINPIRDYKENKKSKIDAVGQELAAKNVIPDAPTTPSATLTFPTVEQKIINAPGITFLEIDNTIIPNRKTPIKKAPIKKAPIKKAPTKKITKKRK